MDPQECIWVVAYDAELTVKNVIELGRGTQVRVGLHLPTLIAAVVTAGCERFILAHNHPSGRAWPSAGDKDLTVKVMAAANAAGLYFEDHIIITPSRKWMSMTLSGLMEPVDYAKDAMAASQTRKVNSLWATNKPQQPVE